MGFLLRLVVVDCMGAAENPGMFAGSTAASEETESTIDDEVAKLVDEDTRLPRRNSRRTGHFWMLSSMLC